MTPDDDDDIEDRIAALLAGDLDESARARLEAEIDRHPRWLAVLAVLATPASRAAEEPDGSTARRVASAQRMRVVPGTTVGRYEVISEIGRGGMGVVLEARDPVLRRVVALKLLHASDPARAIREARALARVRHPAVIEVFDVGRFRDGVYIAMERLHGSTLGAWLRERSRSTRPILDVFLAAGEGLAAAHEAGLVHRDFKPGNVIVAPGSRVIVLDFGLARPLEPAAPTLEGVTTSEPARAGTNVAGTPAYMAPE
jgi:serine/threonine protein kinase